MAPRGMVVTPHHLATQSALAILREGGTAMEAMVAAAATIAVVYPHMNSIGGDGFWLIIPPDGDPVVIEACGVSGGLVKPDLYTGLKSIPYTGPKSAITVAGTVGGWNEALNYVSNCGYQKMSTARLLADAITYAENGFPISQSYVDDLNDYVTNKKVSKEFSSIFLKDDNVPKVGDSLCQKNLAKTLRHLAENGLISFYNGDLAKCIASDMMSLGIPITEDDLSKFTPIKKSPLRLRHTLGELYNVPPPTQGLVSLAVLGMLDKLGVDGKHDGEFIHTTVEATKCAFHVRDRYITDPAHMRIDPQSLLNNEAIEKLAKAIDVDQASSTGKGLGPGDTVWMGIMDNKGFSVSFIQSIYHIFGSGVVLPQTGILWQNRGVSFTLDKNHILELKPGKKPFHTLNPAAAKLNDGRIIIYGTRGGDGQSQTQAAVFHRYVVQKMPLQKSVSAPRWLYGRLTGDHNDNLHLEGRFSKETIKYLNERGHKLVMLPSFSSVVGHAGAIVKLANGYLEGAFDPRSDGSAAGF